MTETVPKHIGVILDGNRRWAKQRGLPSLEGHRQGYKALKDMVDAAIKRNIAFVSAYIFSTENWSRTQEEVNYLMELAFKMISRDLKELHDKNVRLVWLGTDEKMSDTLRASIQNAEAMTKHNTGLTMALCFNYGGQREITDAVKRIIASGMAPDDVAEDIIAAHLYHPEVPPVDLVIRTSGEQRTSNFMLWRTAYSELLFIEKHWPDFNETDLDNALEEYARRCRRFGG